MGDKNPRLHRIRGLECHNSRGWVRCECNISKAGNRVLLITKVLPWFLGEWAKRAAGNCSHDYPWFKKESGADHFRLINAE
jgi:hypothetical protein